MRKVYLDYAATTPVHKKVKKAMEPYFSDTFANPSSLHQFGQDAKVGLDKSRKTVADFIGAKSKEIIFTSGGSESDNLALKGLFFKLTQDKDFKPHIITSAIEHSAILNTCKFLEKQGAKVSYIDPNQKGLIDPEDIKKEINKNTILVSIMHANNEVGTIEPIQKIGEIIKKTKQNRQENDNNTPIYFHTDAVQTFGHLPISVDDLKVDMLSVSAHKLYGPKGVGALFVREGVKLLPLIHAGEQERKRRGSTHNTPGIIGLAKAVEIAGSEMEKERRRLTKLRNYFIKELKNSINGVKLNGHPEKRLPNNVNVAIKGVEGEALLMSLDEMGIGISTGSACSSTELKPSHVLMAMGFTHLRAHTSVRFSMGRYTKKKDVRYVIKKLKPIVQRLRDISPLK